MWHKHSLERGCKYDCGISGYPKIFTNQQSFPPYIKKEHSWFHKSHLIYLKKHTSLSVNKHENGKGAKHHNADDDDADYGLQNCSMTDDHVIHEDLLGLDYDTITGEFDISCLKSLIFPPKPLASYVKKISICLA